MGAGEGRRVERGIGLAALVLRLLHNRAMMASPLYLFPLGGHVAFLEQAERIARGAFVPDRAFTENSPLFPYLLAPVFAIAGANALVLARLLGIAVDSVTAVLVARIATRRFGRFAGAAAGLLYAAYGPAVFFSAELIYVPYALCCCAAAVLLLVGEARTPRRALGAGIACGLAIDLMPSLLAGVPLFGLVLLAGARERRAAGVLAGLAGVALAIAPVSALNYAASGKLVLLTMSPGHAFYVGHNPQARAGYYLPDRVGTVQAGNRGSVFDSMHRIAEETVGHAIPDDQVSAYYFARGWRHVVDDPGSELRLLGLRLAAFCNWYEATTYADFYFQRETSPVLRVLPGFTLLFALAAVGLAYTSPRRELALLVFPLTALAGVLVFFYLARFRMPAVPFLCCFAGRGVAFVAANVRHRRLPRLAASGAIAAGALVLASWPLAVVDTSNEWNKVGTVFLTLDRYPDAEQAFLRAATANPTSPWAFLNLERVYDRTGAAERAEAARVTAERLMAAERGGERFRDALSR